MKLGLVEGDQCPTMKLVVFHRIASNQCILKFSISLSITSRHSRWHGNDTKWRGGVRNPAAWGRLKEAIERKQHGRDDHRCRKSAYMLWSSSYLSSKSLQVPLKSLTKDDSHDDSVSTDASQKPLIAQPQVTHYTKHKKYKKLESIKNNNMPL